MQVNTEFNAGKGRNGNDLGRMDIVLTCNPDWIIVIENKVDAGEQADQLLRYAEWLDMQQAYKDRVLIFLTTTGYDSETGKNVDYLTIMK
jgi:hypothetical protein